MTRFVKDIDDSGKTISRKMVDKVADVESFRTSVLVAGDTTYQMRTKGGFPEVTKTVKKAPVNVEPTQNRGFVFRALTTPRPLLATIANKDGGAMKVASRTHALGEHVAYVVGKIKTPLPKFANSKWGDVWRVSDGEFSINNGATTSALTYHNAAINSPDALPFVTATPAGGYEVLAFGSTDRSTLVVGRSDGADAGVYSVGGDGSAVGEIPVPANNFNQATRAGVYCSPDGQFFFVGGKLTATKDFLGNEVASSSTSDATLASVKVAATYAPPYLSLVASTSNTVIFNPEVVGYVPPMTLTPSGVTEPTTCPFNLNFVVAQSWDAEILGPVDPDNVNVQFSLGVTRDGTHSRFGTYNYTPDLACSGEFIEHFYENTPFAMTVKYGVDVASHATISRETVTLVFPNELPDEFNPKAFQGYFITYNTGVSVATAEVVLDTYPALKVVEGVHTVTTKGGYAAESTWVVGTRYTGAASYTQTMSNAAAADRVGKNGSFEFGTYAKWDADYGGTSSYTPRLWSSESSYTARDFIFIDPLEDVFIYLETVTTAAADGINDAGNLECYISADYVVNFRGAETRFSAKARSLLEVAASVFGTGVGGRQIKVNNAEHGFDGNDPNQIFLNVAQAYMGVGPQLICAPFTHQGNCPYIAFTTKDEEAGGAPPQIYVDFSVIPVRPYPSTTQHATEKYQGVVSFVALNFSHVALSRTPNPSGQILDATFPWADVLAAHTPFRIQMANGVAGAWQGKLKGGFADGSQVEISRI